MRRLIDNGDAPAKKKPPIGHHGQTQGCKGCKAEGMLPSQKAQRRD